MYSIKAKRILVTGATGTIGKELISLLSKEYNHFGEIIGLDNNESTIFHSSELTNKNKNIKYYVCDIRSYEDLKHYFRKVDIVFHTAALKHVISCENSPEQAVRTNITGTQNVIRASIENLVERVVFTSSDKAVNPTNVMGTSKLMGERIVSAANASNNKTLFTSTRFGNVLGSSGSVIKIFQEQLENRQPLTITDNSMTRFVMSKDQAARLVMASLFSMQGGEVFITKMPSIKITDLAEAMIQIYVSNSELDFYHPGTKIIGTKAGEKEYEELMSLEEIRRSVELDDFFVILPALKNEKFSYQKYNGQKSQGVIKPYNSSSEIQLSVQEIRELLIEYKLV